MNSILTVCEGNICRSPMAQGMLSFALPNVQVRSAGLNALIGHAADESAVKLMQERGIDITSHRAVQLSRQMCMEADLILVMDSDQRRRVEDLYPQVRGRVMRLAEYLGSDVVDPYRKSEQVFRDCLRVIEQGVQQWLERIHRL